MSRNIYIFNPGGLPYESGGDACRKFWMKPLKKTNLGVGQPFSPPKDTILFQCSLGIDVYTENFDYMNWVRISIIVLKYLSLRWFSVSFLSSELVLFFTEVKVKAFF